MTDQQMQDLVKECGLVWHRGYLPLFNGDPTNRYAVLIEAAIAAEREACAALCMTFDDTHEANRGHGPEMCAEAIRARSNEQRLPAPKASE